jgi:hypothetical protein
METTDLTATDSQGDGALQRRQPQALSTISVDQLTTRVSKVRTARNDIMEEGVHYDKIPGTDSPALLKPGAEILCTLFQLDPQPEVDIRDLEGDHREYVVTGSLYHIPSGTRVGGATGSCSTLESKYRYRNAQRTCPECGEAAIIKGKEEYGGGWLCWKKKGGCGAKWEDGASAIEDQELGKVENSDPADIWNTALKMAKKRWLVDGVLTVTGASELFTQDTDELKDMSGSDVGGQPTKTPAHQRRNANTDGRNGDGGKGRRPNASGRQAASETTDRETTDRTAETGGKADSWYDGALKTVQDRLDEDATTDGIRSARESWPAEHPITDWPDEKQESLRALLRQHEARARKSAEQAEKAAAAADSYDVDDGTPF